MVAHQIGSTRGNSEAVGAVQHPQVGERQLSHCHGSYGTLQCDSVTQFQPLDGKSGGDGDGIKMGTGRESSAAPAKLGS